MKKLIVFTSVLSLIFITGAKTEPLRLGKGIQFTETSLAHALQITKTKKK